MGTLNPLCNQNERKCQGGEGIYIGDPGLSRSWGV